jgi:hypothetical protein
MIHIKSGRSTYTRFLLYGNSAFLNIFKYIYIYIFKIKCQVCKSRVCKIFVCLSALAPNLRRFSDCEVLVIHSQDFYDGRVGRLKLTLKERIIKITTVYTSPY